MLAQQRTDLERTLRQNRAINALPNVELDALMASMRRVELSGGQLLFKQGDRGSKLHVVVDGVLSVHFTDGSIVTRLRDVRRGEFIGEMAVLDPAPRSATMGAQTDCVLYELDALDLEALAESHPQASTALIDALCFNLAQRLRGLTRKLDALVAEIKPPERPAPGISGGFQRPSKASVGAPDKPVSAPSPSRSSSSLVRAWRRLLKPITNHGESTP